MKNLINYLYNIDITSIKDFNGYYYIKDDKSNYLLIKYNDSKNFHYIYQKCQILNMNTFFTYQVRLNIYGTFISTIEGNKYVLLDIKRNYSDEVDLIDMIDFHNRSSSIIRNEINYQCNWDLLWESKIDYLHSHILDNKLNNKKQIIFLYYYLGVAENALIYIRNIKNILISTKYDKVCFAHRRIFIPNIKMNFNNPFNLLIDLDIRDIAEYIKCLYLNDGDYLNELEYYLKTNSISNYTASLLYARIVYPSYFFDYYENSSSYYSKKFYEVNEYEEFIKKTYDLIKSYVPIDKISWL